MEQSKTSTKSKPSQPNLSAQELLGAAFDSTDAVRFIVDAQGIILHYNRKAYENSILIHKRELHKGDNLFEFAGDTLNKVQNHLKKQLAKSFSGETFVTENEVKYNFQSKWFQTEYVPIVHNMKIVAVSISTHDITSKKNAELQKTNLIADLKTTNQHRLQQITYALESLISRNDELLLTPELRASVHKQIGVMMRELMQLRNKVNSWNQTS